VILNQYKIFTHAAWTSFPLGVRLEEGRAVVLALER
jgi:hypothetical protein